MPLYEYKCSRCGAVSEYLEKQGEWLEKAGGEKARPDEGRPTDANES